MVLRAARQRLSRDLSDDNATEVRILAEWAFGLTRLELVTRESAVADAKALVRFEAAVSRRIAGEPVHRIIGRAPVSRAEICFVQGHARAAPG